MRHTSAKRYKHDCDKCTFLGTFEEYDLYFCGEGRPTVIARFGHDGPSYYSGLTFAEPDINYPLFVAKQRAKKEGLL